MHLAISSALRSPSHPQQGTKGACMHLMAVSAASAEVAHEVPRSEDTGAILHAQGMLFGAGEHPALPAKLAWELVCGWLPGECRVLMRLPGYSMQGDAGA